MIVEVGFRAKRDENGNFLPPTPIYYDVPGFRPRRDKYTIPLRKPIYLSRTAEWDIYYLFCEAYREHKAELLQKAAGEGEEHNETNEEKT